MDGFDLLIWNQHRTTSGSPVGTPMVPAAGAQDFNPVDGEDEDSRDEDGARLSCMDALFAQLGV